MSTSPTVNVDVSGSGPPLLFIHGWLNDAEVWSGVISELDDAFTCIAVDLRGHGKSEPAGEGNYGRALVLDDLRKVLDEHAGGQAVLVGHSLGGYLSLALAIQDPSRVVGLGLVAAGPGFRSPKSLASWNESVQSIADGRDLAPGMEAISMHVDSMVMDRLGEIEVPAAVIVGERDKRFLASADVFDKHLNVVSRTIVADAGHMVHAKQPAAVAEQLRTAFTPAED